MELGEADEYIVTLCKIQTMPCIVLIRLKYEQHIIMYVRYQSDTCRRIVKRNDNELNVELLRFIRPLIFATSFVFVKWRQHTYNTLVSLSQSDQSKLKPRVYQLKKRQHLFYLFNWNAQGRYILHHITCSINFDQLCLFMIEFLSKLRMQTFEWMWAHWFNTFTTTGKYNDNWRLRAKKSLWEFFFSFCLSFKWDTLILTARIGWSVTEETERINWFIIFVKSVWLNSVSTLHHFGPSYAIWWV